MDIERPHRTTSTPTTTSELFICFTSRLSKSSSMRLSSKSILSPGRAATSVDKSSNSLSLSSSLSRRLRHNGSLRGGAQSPAMFPSTSKKNKGSSGFADNPEPSSPKVTCIGQVRVKTKKQGKKMKMRACRSKRLSGGGTNGSSGEASFRRIEHSHSHSIDGVQTQQGQQECGLNHRNQRWVHLPLTICEALRAFGSEFSCLFPCKSSCFSSGGFCGGGEKGKTGEERENPNPNSCAVFRWLVSLQDGEGGEKRRDIELVVGGEEEVRDNSRVVMMERECSRRRSIFDDMEFDDLFPKDDNNNNVRNDNNESNEINGNDSSNGDDEEGGRVSVCVPPKNALLLMRCRSDPLKMASLSRKLWEVPLPLQDDGDDDGEAKHKGDYIEAERDVGLAEKTEEIEDDKTEEIGNEKIEEFREENAEVIGEETEVLGKGSEEIDGVLEKLDEMLGFAGEELKEAEEEEQETEEKQSVENRGMVDEEEFEDSEDTQLIEDEITANGGLIETILVEEFEDVENEQDLVISSAENEQDLVVNLEENERNLLVNSENNEQELNNSENNEQELKVEKEEIAELELDSDDISTIQDEEERQKCESSEILTSFSCSLNSSEESTAESKDREDEQEQEQEKDPVEIDVEEQEQEQELVARKSIEGGNKKTLPDCLLLMMCEPKVSMEVSKETWVCSTDFLRWLPERHHKKVVNKPDNLSDSSIPKKNKPAAVAAMPPPHVQQRYEQAAQPPIQPGRSSISFPAGGGSVANLIEQKLTKGGSGYEPFVLTRCKSAPLRSAAKTLPPEMACSLWGRENGRKLEPHRPATFGVGAAGVGF
ncbi:myb-like protein V [Chenopodium quinoa]|uniref:myb-like protein V n=1 Tax=Chenopodium quinoa TaxID=63459 RepID=UPI000B78B208|nr:myb-like protein V [Chenopodium quinoa]